MEPEDALDALLSRHVDLSLTLPASSHLPPAGRSARCTPSTCWTTSMDVALPFDHPLAGRAEVDLADLADADWIIATPGVPCWQLTLGGLRPGRFRAAGPALRGRVHRRGRAGRGGARRRAAPPARPARVRHRADRAAPGRRGSAGPPDRRPDPRRARAISRTSRRCWTPCAGWPARSPSARSRAVADRVDRLAPSAGRRWRWSGAGVAPDGELIVPSSGASTSARPRRFRCRRYGRRWPGPGSTTSGPT